MEVEMEEERCAGECMRGGICSGGKGGKRVVSSLVIARRIFVVDFSFFTLPRPQAVVVTSALGVGGEVLGGVPGKKWKKQSRGKLCLCVDLKALAGGWVVGRHGVWDGRDHLGARCRPFPGKNFPHSSRPPPRRAASHPLEAGARTPFLCFFFLRI